MQNWSLISVAHDNSAFHFGQCFLALSPYPIFSLLFSAFQVLQCSLFAEQPEGMNHHYLVIQPIA
jgi:hypothetical protein